MPADKKAVTPTDAQLSALAVELMATGRKIYKITIVRALRARNWYDLEVEREYAAAELLRQITPATVAPAIPATGRLLETVELPADAEAATR